MKILNKLCLAVLCVLALFGCNKPAKDDTLIIGTSADNPPYEFVQNDKVVGFDIDLITHIAEEMGKKVLVKNMEFSALIPALTSGHVDLIIAGITASEVRTEHVDFSDVYATSTVSVLTLKSKNITKVEDLAGKKVGVQLGTTWEMIAKGLADRIANMEIHSINNNLVLMEELKNGNIDAIILEDLQVKKLEQQNAEFAGFTIDNAESSYAIAFAKGSELKDKVNEAITALKAKGKIQELKEKWLNMPEDVKTEEAPATANPVPANAEPVKQEPAKQAPAETQGQATDKALEAGQPTQSPAAPIEATTNPA